MSVASDFKILRHMVFGRIRGATHRERLESYYRDQAAGYDDFRRRLLPGRAELFAALDVPAGGRWVDMGGGTGANLEQLGGRMSQLADLYLVDLSPSLLAIARQRLQANRWSNVHLCEADATTFAPDGGPVDVVTFSYSLTMIADWFAALERAWSLLRPGGRIGVVDFYVSRKHPVDGLARHRWLTRHFWPTWFATDNVFLNADHLPYLQRRFAGQRLTEGHSKVPYVPFGRVPYYIFIGEKQIAPG
jgi:S-adenosylmethionine-diacylgycerolhomoserine-N-methlytransferase